MEEAVMQSEKLFITLSLHISKEQVNNRLFSHGSFLRRDWICLHLNCHLNKANIVLPKELFYLN